MLSKKDLQEIRKTLKAEQARLLQKVETRIEQDEGEREELNPDRSDLASDFIGRDRRFALRSIEVDMLEQVESALARLDDGSYGNCQECGDPIDPERLKALPYAPYCMSCQQKLAAEGHHH